MSAPWAHGMVVFAHADSPGTEVRPLGARDGRFRSTMSGTTGGPPPGRTGWSPTPAASSASPPSAPWAHGMVALSWWEARRPDVRPLGARDGPPGVFVLSRCACPPPGRTGWSRWLAPPMTPAMMSRSPWCEVCGAGLRARGMIACCYRETASLLRSKSLKTPHPGHVFPSQNSLAPTGAGITPGSSVAMRKALARTHGRGDHALCSGWMALSCFSRPRARGSRCSRRACGVGVRLAPTGAGITPPLGAARP